MLEKWKQLEQMVRELLAESTEEAYEKLYIILRNKEYEPILRKHIELGLVREMVECWKEEKDGGNSWIFYEINTLEQAKHTYLWIKHGLWRIEQGLSWEKCIPFVEKVSQRKQSKYLIVWIAYANLSRPEEVIACLGEYMMQYDVVSALEILSYGLLFFPNSTEILLQKAQCLMEVNMWQEALKTLYLIKNPEEEIGQIIIELEDAMKQR